MTRDPGLVAVTGAGGYLGSLVVKRLHAGGINTVSLGRSVKNTPVPFRYFDLSQPLSAGALKDVRTVVHCAWNLTATSWDEMWLHNVEGTLKLITAAKTADVDRFIFVSSMSAYLGTGQMYGLAKLACEQAVLREGWVVVRPGLVCGSDAGGIFAKLSRLAQMPIVPIVAARSRQYVVEATDLVRAIETMVIAKSVPAVPIGVAHPLSVEIGQLMSDLVRRRTGKPLILPVPAAAVHAVLLIGEWLGMRLPFRSDSLAGLIRPAPGVPNEHVLRDLGVELKAYAAFQREF